MCTFAQIDFDLRSLSICPQMNFLHVSLCNFFFVCIITHCTYKEKDVLLMKYIDKIEENTFAEAPKVTWKPTEMIAVARKKKDDDMDEKEFSVKYGACRHEAFRNSLISSNFYRRINNAFYWIELNIINQGEAVLAKAITIDRPIFVIGDYRSGTSVLERLIAHHPYICHFTFNQAFCWKAPQLWNGFGVSTLVS
ncbi:hypothetical protein RFI_17320, partial [Reticulomyxa filosa]